MRCSAAAAEARDHPHLDRQVGEAPFERHPVLLRKDGGGDEHQRLLAGLGRLESRAQRDLGLAVAHVAADEAVHGVRRLHVVLDLVDGLRLVVGLLVGERLFQAAHELAVRRIGEPGDGLTGGVQLEQLAGHLHDRRARPGLDRLPVRAAELVERRGGAGGADVAADLADLVVRDEDAVVPAELEQQVVASDVGDGARLDAGEAGDAVVLVHHEVARAHVEERAEARAGDEAPLARRGADQRAFVDDGELEVLGDEALAQRRGDEVQPGARLAAVRQLLRRHDLGREVAQPVGGALGLALVAEDDEHAVVVVDQAHEVALRAADVARRELRPRGRELDGLVALHDVEVQRLRQEGAGVGERRVEPLAQRRARHGRRDLGLEVGEAAVRLVGVEHGPAEAGRGRHLAERREATGERRERAHRRAALQLRGRLLAALALPVGHRLAQPGHVLVL